MKMTLDQVRAHQLKNGFADPLATAAKAAPCSPAPATAVLTTKSTTDSGGTVSNEEKSFSDKDNTASIFTVIQLDIHAVRASYLKTGSVHRTGKEFGVSGDTIYQKLLKAGVRLNNAAWKESEIAILRAAYADPEGVNLAILAGNIGRTYAAIACKAEEIGITSARGKHTRTAEALEANRTSRIEVWKKQPHPRGMAGKKHSEETKEIISQKGIGRVVSAEHILKGLKTRAANGTMAPNHSGRSWKAGWREIAGRRIYARSRWEANYARYLEWLKINGQIVEWEHEPQTFWFEAIKRGCRSYLPDFRVTLAGGAVEYHETKGWMDARSVTKIKRMAKYHPTVVLIVRDSAWFKANTRKLSGLIPGWESKTSIL